jgi:hypothetical protein
VAARRHSGSRRRLRAPDCCRRDKYSYRELDEYTDLITRTLKTLPIVSKISSAGLLQERVYLEYSQERLAGYGIKVGSLERVLGARNIAMPGGMTESGDKNLTVDPSGEFKSEHEIGDVLVSTPNGRTLYLRDVTTVARGYESPARFLNYYGSRSEDGTWRRARAVTPCTWRRRSGVWSTSTHRHTRTIQHAPRSAQVTDNIRWWRRPGASGTP